MRITLKRHVAAGLGLLAVAGAALGYAFHAVERCNRAYAWSVSTLPNTWP